jgi:hypothetical protein
MLSLLGFAPGQQRTHLNTITSSPLPTTDADEFQDISAAQRDQLLADLREEHMMTNLTHGPADGKSTVYQLDAKISSWTASASKSKSSCSEHLPWLSGTKDFPTHVSTHWLKAQAEVPSQICCRPSGYWEDRVPRKGRQQALHPFIQAVRAFGNEDLILMRSNKRPFHLQSLMS